jgi:hypothetical protein
MSDAKTMYSSDDQGNVYDPAGQRVDPTRLTKWQAKVLAAALSVGEQELAKRALYRPKAEHFPGMGS